jgi:hypothetical protein
MLTNVKQIHRQIRKVKTNVYDNEKDIISHIIYCMYFFNKIVKGAGARGSVVD